MIRAKMNVVARRPNHPNKIATGSAKICESFDSPIGTDKMSIKDFLLVRKPYEKSMRACVLIKVPSSNTFFTYS